MQVRSSVRNGLPPADEVCTDLRNHGTYFTVDVAVGTPGQTFSVVADTGSNTLIVPSCMCQQAGKCDADDRCFVGTDRSSTFTIPGGVEHPQSVYLAFGSGDIGGVLVKDNARVGQRTAYMKDGLVLMTDKVLNFGGSFEGILGLGLPQQEKKTQEARQAAPAAQEGPIDINDAIRQIAERITGQGAGGVSEDAAPAAGPTYIASGGARQIPDYQGGATPAIVDPPPGFLEQAGIGTFSMCFNYEGDGVLRLGTPPAPVAHGSLGTQHWGLDLQGISVGEASTPVAICSKEDMQPGQKAPCGAIPDSGTTFLMAPESHVAALLDSICDEWPRCSQNHSAMVKATADAAAAMVKDYGVDPFGIQAASKGAVAKLLLMDCDRWMNAANGLDELPPIKFHIQGSNGTKQSLALPPRTYIVQTKINETERQAMNLSSTLTQICSPAMGAMDYVTADAGPVWIMGMPLFYEFAVGYDMQTSPPSISFTSTATQPCGGCGKEAGLLATSTRANRPRWIEGAPRLPTSLDTSKPF